jgi:predicted DNA-binding transcriptional regulator AlpA
MNPENDMKKSITIDEVCRIANCSRPTIYRRIKTTGFPKPKKVPATSELGPRTINRWDHAEVMEWLLKGHDPRWSKPPIKQIEAAMIDDRTQDAHNTDRGSWYKQHELVINAVAGGLLAGLAVYVFGELQ